MGLWHPPRSCSEATRSRLGSVTDESYRAELEMVARKHTVLLSRSDLHDGRVAPEKPLRPSHALLYDLALRLRPSRSWR